MHPLLTIITITHNDAAGLTATLASAARLRERSDVEYIIIDGNVAGECSVAAPAGVRVIRREPLGISDAFNVGLTAAHGVWIWFLNGGDTVHPGADVEFVMRTLALTNAGAVIFDIELEDGIAYRPTLPEAWPPVFNWIPHPATFVRTKLLSAAGGFSTDFRIAADLDLWFRLFSQDAMVDLIHHRVAWFAAGGVSSTQTVTLARENVRILWAHRGHLIYQLIRQNLLIPYRIVMAASTLIFGKTPRWLVRLPRRE